MKNTHLNRYVNDLLSLGFKIRKGKKHNILIGLNNRRLAIPSTPSDYRAFQNFIHEVKRYLIGA